MISRREVVTGGVLGTLSNAAMAAPEEAQKWYQRAKYAITHGATNVEIEHIHNREEVLAVWEYLERSLDIPTIAAAFNKLRAE